MNKTLAIAASAALALMATTAQVAKASDAIPYPHSGTYNNATYSFTASATGDVIAYFAGSGAGYDNQLGLLVNGVAQGGFGLDDHTTTIGTAYDFGSVTAGDSLVFVLKNITLGKDAYSLPALNGSYDNGPATGTTDGHNHIYSTSYTDSAASPANLVAALIPAGTYVAFEDLPFPGSDYNYFDESFVFTNVSASVPEPGAWAMMLLGFGGLGAMMRSRRQQAVSA